MRADKTVSVTAPLGWGHSEPERDELTRRRAEPIIRNVLLATLGLPSLDISIELGAACPFGLQHDRDIWIREIRRQEAQQ